MSELNSSKFVSMTTSSLNCSADQVGGARRLLCLKQYSKAIRSCNGCTKHSPDGAINIIVIVVWSRPCVFNLTFVDRCSSLDLLRVVFLLHNIRNHNIYRTIGYSRQSITWLILQFNVSK